MNSPTQPTILVAIIIVMMIVVNIYIALIFLEKSIISSLAMYSWYISKEKHFQYINSAG